MMDAKRTAIVGISMLLILLILAGSVQAMSSTTYRLDWFTPLTGGGGGAASSTHYAVNLTIGQSAYNASSSASYTVGLGYWYGISGAFRVYLPSVLK
jgi:hypothetical protein